MIKKLSRRHGIRLEEEFMRGWIPARNSGHRPSTCYDLMWSWCNKRHAPSPFSHEPLSSSHASTAVLPLPIYVRIHGTRVKNEKEENDPARRGQNADRRENEMGREYSSYSLDRHRPSWRLAEVAWDPGRLDASILAFLNRLSHGAIPWERFNWPKKRPRSRRGYVLIFFSSTPFPLVVFRSSPLPLRDY